MFFQQLRLLIQKIALNRTDAEDDAFTLDKIHQKAHCEINVNNRIHVIVCFLQASCVCRVDAILVQKVGTAPKA